MKNKSVAGLHADWLQPLLLQTLLIDGDFVTYFLIVGLRVKAAYCVDLHRLKLFLRAGLLLFVEHEAVLLGLNLQN